MALTAEPAARRQALAAARRVARRAALRAGADAALDGQWPPEYRALHPRTPVLPRPWHVEPWLPAAACIGAGVDMYPDATDKVAVARALAVCARCPVRAHCGELAASLPKDWGRHGVWGGRPPIRLRGPRLPVADPDEG